MRATWDRTIPFILTYTGIRYGAAKHEIINPDANIQVCDGILNIYSRRRMCTSRSRDMIMATIMMKSVRRRRPWPMRKREIIQVSVRDK